jgi:hypothetical protein
MSIFVRPDSPPPRQPSPDIPPAPLPYPHHPRRAVSQPKIKVYSPSRPPGLQSPTKTIKPVRSYDQNSLRASRKETYPMQQPLPSRSGAELKSTLQAVPRRLSSAHVRPVANPPLPSVPAASNSKRTLRPQPNSFDSLYLPHVDDIGANALPQRKSPSKPVLPEKNKSLGLACLWFFRSRNSSRYSQSPVAAI